jgi:hypothetical protein
VFLVVTAFPDERHRTWRAVPVAQTLAFPLAACWAVERWRLNRVRRAKDPNAGRANVVARAAEGFFAKALRENERDKVHGTAWYLLGAFTRCCCTRATSRRCPSARWRFATRRRASSDEAFCSATRALIAASQTANLFSVSSRVFQLGS